MEFPGRAVGGTTTTDTKQAGLLASSSAPVGAWEGWQLCFEETALCHTFSRLWSGMVGPSPAAQAAWGVASFCREAFQSLLQRLSHSWQLAEGCPLVYGVLEMLAQPVLCSVTSVWVSWLRFPRPVVDTTCFQLLQCPWSSVHTLYATRTRTSQKQFP